MRKMMNNSLFFNVTLSIHPELIPADSSFVPTQSWIEALHCQSAADNDKMVGKQNQSGDTMKQGLQFDTILLLRLK